MLSIQTKHSVYGRVFTRRILIDEALLGSTEMCWCRNGLRDIAEASEGTPIHTVEIQSFLSGLKLLAQFPQWCSVLETAPQALTMREITASFRLLERVLSENKASPRTMQRVSETFRRVIKKILLARDDCPQLVALKRLYRPLVSVRHPPRQLISDMADPAEVQEREPLGALPHSDIAELRRRTANKIHGTLRRILEASQYEIDAFETNSAWLQRHRGMALPDRIHRKIAALIGKEAKKIALKRVFDTVGTVELLAGYLQYFDVHHGKYPPSLVTESLFPGASVLMKYAASECFGYKSHTFRYLAAYAQIGNSRILVACLIALQIHTGWNASSVTGLTLDAVQTIDRGVLIQGFKTRTGDHTPIAHIAPSDAAAIWAIRFLVRRLDALQKYGFVPPGSKSLWLGSRYSKDGPRLFIASNALHSFQKRHRLPQFSFDQIRPEVIAASVVNGEIENGRRIAGHVGISTTGHYLDQLLLNRLNSAINLEFQKRLERSVRWNIREESSQEVSPALLDLAPIGDGASCRDPQHPPVAAWFDNTGCKAQDCHRGNGCPNREILIDADRIREIALTTRYYRKSWKELAEENWERFEKQHLPALIFNTTLKSIVRRGPYGFLFRTIEGEINALDR